MNQNNRIIDKKSSVCEKIEEKISYYLDIKDIVKNNEYIEFLGDVSKIAGVFQKGTKLILLKKFEAFLMGFNGNDCPSEERLSKLIKYIDNEKKAEFIADVFSKILLSKSKKACLIMGSIMKKIVDNKDSLTHYDLIYIDSLTKFFDVDIINFKFFCKYSSVGNKDKWVNIDGIRFKRECNKVGIDSYSVRLTIEKCVSCQLIMMSSDIDLDLDEQNLGFSSVDYDEGYTITKPGKFLYEYINNLKL